MASMLEQEVGPATFTLARWASTLRWASIPRAVRDHAKLLLLDGIGCSVFGLHRDAGKALFQFVAGSARSRPEATIWGSNVCVPMRDAGLVNGAAAHSTNVGDTHRTTIFHTNYVTPQATIAVGEGRKASGREILTAIVAGNEAGARAGLAISIGAEGGYFTEQGRGWHATGTIGPLAAAVAAGRVLRLSPRQMVQAIVLGGTQITGMYRPCGTHMGKHWYAGKAVANGIDAAELASTGFVAGYRYFEDGACHGSGTLSPSRDVGAVRRGLGDRWETLNVDMAIYPTKKIYYANLDALLQLIRNERLGFANIERVVVLSAFARAHDFGAFREPHNATEAFNSLRYTIAAAAHDGEFTFRQLAPAKFRHPGILAFSRDRIDIRRDRDLEKMLPGKWPGGIEVWMRDGRRFSARVEHHLGEIQLPLGVGDVHAKFRIMAASLGARRIDRVLDMVDGLESLGDISAMTRELRPNKIARARRHA